MSDTCIWTGRSGKTYQYNVQPIGCTLPEQAGNYIFARYENGIATAVYIGEASNLQERHGGPSLANSLQPRHERQREAVSRFGANQLHWHITVETNRFEEEKDLIQAYDPPLNAKHRNT